MSNQINIILDYISFLEIVADCDGADLKASNRETVLSFTVLKNVTAKTCKVNLTNVPQPSVIEFKVQSSVPLGCNNCSAGHCNSIRLLVPGWSPLNICRLPSRPIYRSVQTQYPIQIEFYSNIADIGNAFNLTYRGKLVIRKIQC